MGSFQQPQVAKPAPQLKPFSKRYLEVALDHEYKVMQIKESVKQNRNRAKFDKNNIAKEIEELKKANEIATKEAEAIERRLNQLEV